MMDAVHYFVKGLFRGMSESKVVGEQRAELETHIVDRISDLRSQGIPEEEAFSRAIESLGNLDELVDTLSGEKKRVYERKVVAYMMLVGLIYGTLYMSAVGIWFAMYGFGLFALSVAIPGWLGYAIPTLFRFIAYKAYPNEIRAVPVTFSPRIRAAFAGWIIISLSCFAVNLLLRETDTFLCVFWSWMPFFGLFTWPLGEIVYAWIVRNLSSVQVER